MKARARWWILIGGLRSLWCLFLLWHLISLFLSLSVSPSHIIILFYSSLLFSVRLLSISLMSISLCLILALICIWSYKYNCVSGWSGCSNKFFSFSGTHKVIVQSLKDCFYDTFIVHFYSALHNCTYSTLLGKSDRYVIQKCFTFHRKKLIKVWSDMRMSKWWANPLSWDRKVF